MPPDELDMHMVSTGGRAELPVINVPSVRMLNGESPSRLAENCPPREVIKKHRLKKPIPATNILQQTDRDRQTDV